MKIYVSALLTDWTLPEENFFVPEVESMPLVDVMKIIIETYNKQKQIVCEIGKESNVSIIINKKLGRLTDIVKEGDIIKIFLPLFGG